jgi:hypothetical protein
MAENNDTDTPDYEKPQVPAILLKPKAAALALGIGERTLWDLKEKGEIPFVDVGNGPGPQTPPGKERQTIRYLVEDLLAWARARRDSTRENAQEGIEGPPGRHRISNAET